MPGIPTHFVTLEKTLATLKSSGDAKLKEIADVIENNSPYAYFGAIGASIGDFMPAGPGVVGQYVKVWWNVFDIISGWGTDGHPGLLKIVQQFSSAIEKLQPIVDAEDKDALEDLQSELSDMGYSFGAIQNMMTELQTRALRINTRIQGSGPLLPSTAPNAVNPPNAWAARDFLHWKKTGEFARALLERAGSDGRFRAYAYGYIISYVVKTVGAPFVNSIVLGTYRTSWWRHRFIQAWIDAWVYGQNSSGATMSGDDPTPPYQDPTWKSLCGAQLEKKLELDGVTYKATDLMNLLPKGFESEDSKQEQQPFPQMLPDDFGPFWIQAFTDTYGAPPSDSPITSKNLNDAYIMHWLVLWFQTDSLGCNPAPPMAAPEGCDKPEWADPTIPGDAGSGASPPDAGSYEDTDTAEEVCGWILAILGGLIGGPLGIGLIFGGIAVIKDAHEVDWKKLRCDLFWWRVYYFNLLEMIHTVLVLPGLDYPRSAELAVNSMTVPILGTNYLSGANLCKSRDRREGFPSKPWQPSGIGDWTDEPSAWEQPQQVPYLASEYPTFFVDSPSNPLTAGKEVRIGGTWPPGFKVEGGGTKGLPVQFANAVENAIDVLKNPGAKLPNWNLDGDRGLAYMTWQFHNAQYTDPVAVDPES